jgi:5-methylcytosine-specific restriction protein A
MPQRIKPHRVARIRERRQRPTAADRGYCTAAWAKTRLDVLVRDEYQCQSCGRVCWRKQEAHVDHITPKAAGGSDDPANLQCLCQSCHARKTIQEQRTVR